MREHPVLIIGGGLIGLATACALAGRGVAVRVIEALDEVGHGTSFANGGLVTAAMSDPWNAPGALRHFAGAFLDPAAPMKVRPLALPGLVRWGIRFLSHSTPVRYRQATEASFRLAALSLRETRAWRERLSLDYDGRASGSLSLSRNGAAMHDQLAMAHYLRSLGLRFAQLDRAATVALEPALHDIAPDIQGALHFPDDELGDARALCAALAGVILAQGGHIDTRLCATGVVVRSGRVVAVATTDGDVPAERVIIAAGIGSVALLRTAGVRIHVAAAKGYSLTIDIGTRARLPALPVSDGVRHVVVTPLGQRLRIAGTAEFAGNDLRLRPERIAPLAACLRELYPALARVADPSRGLAWTGLRPVSADGLPYIGAAGVAGLHVNAGHGALGLTLAAGSAALLTDLLVGARPALDPAPYSPLRR